MNYRHFLNSDCPRFSSYNQWLLDYFQSRSRDDQKIVCIFIDAFGWMFFDKFKDKSPLLQKFLGEGVAELALSQFPSTTACHVTTLHFGLPVGETGIFEWNYYEPLADGVISPLLYSYAGDTEKETLLKRGIDGEQVFPFVSFYETLAGHDIPSYVFQSNRYTSSSFSNAAFRGASIFPYINERHGLTELAHKIGAHNGAGYFFIYIDRLDSTAHTYGPHSPEATEVGLDILKNIDELLIRTIADRTGTRIVIIADHGQTEVLPSNILYLDQEIPESVSWLKTNRAGQPLVGAGSVRDHFLYTKPEYRQTALEALSNTFSHMADICETSSLIEEGFFGPVESISKRFRERMADIVILPFDGKSLWWSENGKFEKKCVGFHGGLSKDEVEIPRLILDF
jgi:predicted AlkP superfamily pyrophosphatase or phosphodiesterase